MPKITLKLILIFLICIEAAMLVHETGHLAALKANGVEVEEVSIGVGPVIFRTQISDFMFSIKPIPLMAYVMPTQKGFETRIKLPVIQQLLISLAGILMNLLLGALVFFWIRIKEKSPRALEETLCLPKNYFLIFKDLLWEMVTFGRIMPSNRGTLVLAGHPGPFLFWMLYINVLLGILNLLPITSLGLDGGKVFQILILLVLGLVNAVIPVSMSFVQVLFAVINFVTLFMLLMFIFRRWTTQFVVIGQNFIPGSGR